MEKELKKEIMIIVECNLKSYKKKKLEKEDNIIISQVNQFLKENISMEKEMGKGKIFIKMANYYLKENI